MAPFSSLSLDEIVSLQNGLLAWHAENHRYFPWRYTRDPFAILIAEKLLQQTAARDGVVQAYNTITKQYSSPAELARADLEVLEEIVAPLGLKYRARELKALARAVEEDHSNTVPRDYRLLKELPGVGEYIARAVLSFAFQQDIAVVDINVARLLFRVFAIDGPISANPARNRRLWSLASELLPVGRGREFNLAVLDLCASICVPRRPDCGRCPISGQCFTGKDHEIFRKQLQPIAQEL